MTLRLAVPDKISNSYFPALAAVELGHFAREGLDVAHELIFPVDKAYEALRDGTIDIVAGSAHSALAAFPDWRGVKLLCAQAQGMYWFLVMRRELGARRGDVNAMKGRRIGAAPWVDLGLKQLVADSGLDLERDAITIAPVPGAAGAGVNFGVTAAKALEAGTIDGFWANGMGAEVAVRSGAGTIVLDVRRGDGPPGCFSYTLPSIAVREQLVADEPETAAKIVRAIVRTQRALIADVSIATQVGEKLFPPSEAALIAGIVERDLPYYSAELTPAFVDGMNRFAVALGLLARPAAYETVVATQVARWWTA